MPNRAATDAALNPKRGAPKRATGQQIAFLLRRIENGLPNMVLVSSNGITIWHYPMALSYSIIVWCYPMGLLYSIILWDCFYYKEPLYFNMECFFTSLFNIEKFHVYV